MEGVFSRIPFVRTNSIDDSSPKTDASSPTTSPPPVRRQRKGSLRKTLLVASSRDVDRPSLFSRRTSSSERASPALAATETTTPTNEGPLVIETPPPRDRYGSTTDDDADHLTLRARSSSGTYNAAVAAATAAAAAAGGGTGVPAPLSAPPGRRKTIGRSLTPSTLSKAIGALEKDAGSHDYSETEWWGWIILLSTWIVFVVGMGSCLDVWSWAWDVGETPYAPPELEDDPTLPIVGYYPALMAMTGVMAWVWVIVAWVGMKYFRHARVWDGED